MKEESNISSVRDDAHDLNNILHRIYEHAHIIKEKCKSQDEISSGVEKIIQAVASADSLVSRLQAFIDDNAEIKELLSHPAPDSSDSFQSRDAIQATTNNNEHILLVDDDDISLSLAFQRLSALGFKVTACKSAREALLALNNEDQPFSIGLLDQRMPDMSGIELSKELTRRQPGLPIILCTGYKIKATDKDIKDSGIVEIITKPVLIHTIAETIKNILDSK